MTQPVLATRKKKKRERKGRVLPPPERSARLYVEIDSSQVHMFRFLLEAEDNLGFMTVVDRWRAVLLVRFSPHQEKEIHSFLQGMQHTVPFTIIPLHQSHEEPALPENSPAHEAPLLQGVL